MSSSESVQTDKKTPKAKTAKAKGSGSQTSGSGAQGAKKAGASPATQPVDWTRRFAAAAVVISIISLAVAAAPFYLPQRVVENLTGDRLLILGVAQLRPVLVTSQPFHTQLATLYKLTPDDPEVHQVLSTIAPAAQTGIPTISQLRRSFVAVSQSIFIREVVPPKDVWYEQVKVIVESVKPILSGKNQSLTIIYAAEARLRDDDLVGATQELEKLTGHSTEIAADWLTDAHRRLAAKKALKILDAMVLSN